MRTFVLLCILALAGVTLQQAMVTPSCGKFAVMNSSGSVTKYRIKPKGVRRLQAVVTAPAYCAHRTHRRLQAVQEPSCGNGRRLEGRRAQAMVRTVCPVVNGWQCHHNTSHSMC